MGIQLWTVADSVPFGNGRLVSFLMAHGAFVEGKSALRVPASALHAALDRPAKAGLTKEDITFIKGELSGPRVDDFWADEDEFEEEDDIPVDVYNLG